LYLNKKFGALAVAALLTPALTAGAEVNAADYGAQGDGASVDTVAIQKAIDAAATARATVVFKPGIYLSGALFLKSGMELRVDRDVTILGVPDTAAYPEKPTRVAGLEMAWPSALINVYEESNVRITGTGTIDGNGAYWWDRYWRLRKEYEPKGLRWAADYDAKRVSLIQIYKSSHVVLSGLTLERSGFRTVHLCYSHDLTVDGITIRNNILGRGPSTDGIDVDSSSHVLIQNCDISCNDDAICMKAGRDADGLRVNRPTENVESRDCTVRDGAAGFTIGSETSGGIHDVNVSGLHVLGPVPNGILIKSAKTRGGTVERINLHNVALENVAVALNVGLNWNPSYSYARIPAGTSNIPDSWRRLAEPVAPDKGRPHVRHVEISNLNATGARQAFEVNGYSSDPLQDFSFDNISIDAKTGGTIADVENWSFSHTLIKTLNGTPVSLNDAKSVAGLTGVGR
jgi:polygalacturonase